MFLNVHYTDTVFFYICIFAIGYSKIVPVVRQNEVGTLPYDLLTIINLANSFLKER